MKRSDSLPCTSRCCTGLSPSRVLRCTASTAQAPCSSRDDCWPGAVGGGRTRPVRPMPAPGPQPPTWPPAPYLSTGAGVRAPLGHCAALGRSPPRKRPPGSRGAPAPASASLPATHAGRGLALRPGMESHSGGWMCTCCFWIWKDRRSHYYYKCHDNHPHVALGRPFQVAKCFPIQRLHLQELKKRLSLAPLC